MRCPSLRSWRRWLAGRLLLWLTGFTWVMAAAVRADVIVLANRSRDAITFRVTVGKQPSDPMTVSAGDLTVLSLRGSCELTCQVQDHPLNYHLDANAVYVFVQNTRGQVDVSQIDLGGNDETSGGRVVSERPPARVVTQVPVALYVDNFELTQRDVWEPRLRKRIERVSGILERYCRVRLQIVEIGEWAASKDAVEFQQALVEFQRAVQPQPGQVAIGFTGRYGKPVGPLHLGVTQGLLQSHILVREWSATMTEPEREEVLLHEIGHYLGAVHSPDPVSVMRPVLADNQAIRTNFQIKFDPVNSLLINLVSEEIRERRVKSVSELTAGTRLRLSQIYAKLADAVPDDTSARQYQFQVGMVGDSPLASATRIVVGAVRAAAQARAARPAALQGDRLTEYYVRGAAGAARSVPADVAPAALLLGLGIALDDSETLLRNPLTREFSTVVETPQERQQRCQALASPTLLGRRDLAQHFFLSGYLATIVGPAAAESAGIVKELADARSNSGFSFVDLAADLAGIAFAERVLRRELSLDELARRFQVADFLPRIDDLPEGLNWRDLQPRLQDDGDGSLVSYQRTIHERLARLRATERKQDEGG